MQSNIADTHSPSPRRRPRHDSSPSASKRTKFEPMAATPATAGPSARAKGKLPETVDLTRPSAFQPFTGTKKLVIKNLRPANSATRDAQVEEFYRRAHQDAEEALDAIFVGKKPAVPFERIYRGIEDLCRKGEAEKIQRTLDKRMERHVTKVILPRIEKNGGGYNIETAKSLLAEWHTWNSQMVRVNDMAATRSLKQY